MKSLTTQPPDATILSMTIRRRSPIATPPSIFFSSREVRNAGFGRLNATTARFICPGNFVGVSLNAGCAGFTTLGLTAPFGTLAVITGGGSVVVTAELAGRDGN